MKFRPRAFRNNVLLETFWKQLGQKRIMKKPDKIQFQVKK